MKRGAMDVRQEQPPRYKVRLAFPRSPRAPVASPRAQRTVRSSVRGGMERESRRPRRRLADSWGAPAVRASRPTRGAQSLVQSIDRFQGGEVGFWV
jgi:hypothetical protein